MTIALLSCVKTKQDTAAPAGELYISPWFRKARQYAIERSDAWYVLSAKHGLLEPEEVIEPYQTTLYDFTAQERRTWARSVIQTLDSILSGGDSVLMLAGVRYREYLVDPLRTDGVSVDIPMEGLGLGEQLRYLNQHLS